MVTAPFVSRNQGGHIGLSSPRADGRVKVRGRAVQRCLVGFTGSPLPHMRGEVRRLIAKGISGPVNV